MSNFHTYAQGSPRMIGMTKASVWITKQEEISHSQDNLDRPSSKWEFVRFIEVQLTAIRSKEALVGTGLLPDWLRRKRILIDLDTFKDNLCLFRCFAVHQGIQPHRNTHKARELATAFYDIHVRDIRPTWIRPLTSRNDSNWVSVYTSQPNMSRESMPEMDLSKV